MLDKKGTKPQADLLRGLRVREIGLGIGKLLRRRRLREYLAEFSNHLNYWLASLGSSTSRKPSPKRLNPKIANEIVTPGAKAISG